MHHPAPRPRPARRRSDHPAGGGAGRARRRRRVAASAHSRAGVAAAAACRRALVRRQATPRRANSSRGGSCRLEELSVRALLGVSDKAGIVEFARGLRECGVELVATDGTRNALATAGIEVTSVSELTGFPEMLDGRVKTLHPAIHAGILARRDNPEHLAQLEQNGFKTFDIVVVSLYPFAETRARGADGD